MQQLPHNLPWFHLCTLLDKVKDSGERLVRARRSAAPVVAEWARHADRDRCIPAPGQGANEPREQAAQTTGLRDGRRADFTPHPLSVSRKLWQRQLRDLRAARRRMSVAQPVCAAGHHSECCATETQHSLSLRATRPARG